MKESDERYCTRCGYVGEPRIDNEKEHGAFFWVILIVLLCCFILPGILYALWGGKVQPWYVCAKCGARETTVPVDSPVAIAAIAARAKA